MADSVEQSFTAKLYDLYASNTSSNNILIPRNKYEEIVEKLKQSQVTDTRKNSQDYHFLKRYELLSFNGEDRLIKKRSINDDEMILYVTIEETYRIIDNMHRKLGHSGLHKTYREVGKKYGNISRESIQMFQMLCPECQSKKRKFSFKNTVKSLRPQELRSRGLISLIDMRTEPDGKYEWIMVYQELQTKFCFLKALESNLMNVIAYSLLDIFLFIGAPCILHANGNINFISNIILEVNKLWPKCFMVYGNPEHLRETDGVRNIQEKVISWMKLNNSKTWSLGIKFIQLEINTSFNLDMRQTPFKSLFKIDSKIGLSSSISQQALCGLHSEEDLEMLTWNRDSTENNGDHKCSISVITVLNNQGTNNLSDNLKEESVVLKVTALICRICNKPCDGSHNCATCKVSLHESCGYPSNEGCTRVLYCASCLDSWLSSQEEQHLGNISEESDAKKVKVEDHRGKKAYVRKVKFLNS